MDEIIKQVSQKTGISEDKARTAVETVISHLKTMLPPPIAGQIDGLLSGAGGAGGMGIPTNLDDMTKGLGDMLGGK